MNDLQLILVGWADLYRMTAEAAGALVGLLFVVVSLVAQRMEDETLDADKVRSKIGAYLTPTVIFFVSVLLADCLLVFPHHTPLSATLCICLLGVIGLAYAGSMLVGGRKTYFEWHDLIPYAVIPFAAYVLLALSGVLLLHDAQLGLTLVAVSLLSLLALGIRNSWAIAMNVASIRFIPHQS